MLKKRYRVRFIRGDGTAQEVWCYDLETARDIAGEHPDARIFAVYKRARSNVYLDEDEYRVEVR